MLIRLFKSGHLIHSISIIIFAIVLWLPLIIQPQEYGFNDLSAPLYELFLFIVGINPIINGVISLVLIIITALILNSLVTNYNISPKTSLLGFFFLIFFTFANTGNIESNRFLIINLLFILALSELFSLIKIEFTLAPLYNASLLLGIASMFYFPLIIMLVFLWSVLLVLRINKWREYIVSAIGMGLPFFFIFCWYYYFDKSEIFINSIVSSFYFEFSFADFSFLNLLILMLLAGILLPGFFYQINTLFEKNIALRQRLTINIWLFVFSLAVVILDFKTSNSMVLLSIPSAIILTNISSNIKKIKWVDIYVSLLFLLIIINQYSRFFNA